MARDFKVTLDKYYVSGASIIKAKSNGEDYVIFYCQGKDFYKKIQGIATTVEMIKAGDLDVQTEEGRLFGKGVWLDIKWGPGNRILSCTVREDSSN